MINHLTRLAIASFLFAITTMSPLSAKSSDISINYEKFTLDNGLRVIVHEDRKAPVVAVSVWYHVGSKNEPEGKTGFAHLFEHLMFNGSENYDDEWFLPLEEVGATNLNGTTWFDRTNYYQTVPTPALDRVLWMESDRMGHLLGAVTQEKLDNQRGVVQNEKRQGDNQPYGKMEYAQLEGLLPVGHPYRHSTIGSMADLDAATLEDVKSWFKQYYGAANTVLVLAGDIDVKTAKPLVEKYFGDIAAGPALKKYTEFAPKLSANRFEIMNDAVPQARISRNWVGPSLRHKDSTLLDLANTILGGGKTSRLYQALVYEREMATAASAALQDQEIMSFQEVSIDVKDGVSVAQTRLITDQVIAEFLRKGPTKQELERAKTQYRATTIRSLERVNGKASTLARGELYASDPLHYVETKMNWVENATRAEVLAAARRWLNAGFYELTVLPYDGFKTTQSTVDRSKGLPSVGATPELAFPTIEEAVLSNGVKVVLANRDAVPVVNVALQFDAGYAVDKTALKDRPQGLPGLSSFAMAMLDEGTSQRSATDIAEDLESLGASLSARANLDTASITLSAIKDQLAPSLTLMADITLNSTFDQAEIDKLRARWLARIEREKSNPVQSALRILPPLLYGDDHAYGVPFTGSGDAASINSLTRDDLIAYRRHWLRPDKATILIAGDTTMAEIKPMLEKTFGGWKASGAAPAKKVMPKDRAATSTVVIVDKPGAPQSLILAGHLVKPGLEMDEITVGAMNDIIGGQFTARVNMNLREDKGWAYGAYTFLYNAQGSQPFMVYAPVQTDKTGASIQELKKELGDFLSSRPATAEELERVIKNNTRSLPGAYETARAVLDALLESNVYGRPYDYPSQVTSKYKALGLPEVQASAAEIIHPESLTWVIIGDWEKIKSDIETLNLGAVTIMSANDI